MPEAAGVKFYITEGMVVFDDVFGRARVTKLTPNKTLQITPDEWPAGDSEKDFVERTSGHMYPVDQMAQWQVRTTAPPLTLLATNSPLRESSPSALRRRSRSFFSPRAARSPSRFPSARPSTSSTPAR